MSEGLSGDVGDNGTSFGPFQLHVGGALPSGKGRAWAESNAGILYALRQIASVAKGRTGQDAISNIVQRFERPADPSGEIRRALGYYKATPGISSAQHDAVPQQSPMPKGVPNVSAPDTSSFAPQSTPGFMNRQLLSSLMAANAAFASTGHIDQSGVIQSLLSAPVASQTPVSRNSAPGFQTLPAKKGQKVQAVPLPYNPQQGNTQLWHNLFGSAPSLIATPADHEKRAIGNWESDNALDLGVAFGTPVYAAFGGTIGDQFGSLNSDNPLMAGLRLHLLGQGDELYYQHLSKFAPGIKPGVKVKPGQLLGYTGRANGVNHLHIGDRTGTYINMLLNALRG
jgi:murein DD-endopeptidase MepM/ murein hydrolase activator NlpD